MKTLNPLENIMSAPTYSLDSTLLDDVAKLSADKQLRCCKRLLQHLCHVKKCLSDGAELENDLCGYMVWDDVDGESHKLDSQMLIDIYNLPSNLHLKCFTDTAKMFEKYVEHMEKHGKVLVSRTPEDGPMTWADDSSCKVTTLNGETL